MGVFMVGNLAAGFSTRIVEVIVFRGVAGAGGGGIISMAQIIMSDIVSLRDRWVYHSLCKCTMFDIISGSRGKYQGIIGVFVALGNGIGPLIGGVLSEKVTWRVSSSFSLQSSADSCVYMYIANPSGVSG